MKGLLSLIFVLAVAQAGFSQKVEYKKNIISVDKTEIAKVEVSKENFGLTKNFELLSMNGEKLIIAVLSTEYEADKTDNTTMYYNFTFLTTNQTGIFKIASLGAEKSFANLIGKSGIIVNNALDEQKVKEFIAKKGLTPKVAINYTLVSRDKSWPLTLTEELKFMQQGKEIGWIKPGAKINGLEAYELYLPDGIFLGKVKFAGGNNAQNFEFFSAKDDRTRNVGIPQKEVVKFSASVGDGNALTLKRIAEWLVANNYL